MSNKWILLGSAVLFFVVVSNSDPHSEDTYLVAFVGVTPTATGVGAHYKEAQNLEEKLRPLVPNREPKQ